MTPERFRAEMQAAAQLRGHLHIVPVYDSGQHGTLLYFVMPLLAGEPLSTRLQREPKPTLAEAVRMGLGIALGRQHAHERNILHRDIKPGNVWLMWDGTAKILDFGLARVIPGDTSNPSLAGTPDYVAPQLWKQEKPSVQSDLFARGVLLGELVTGRRLGKNETLAASAAPGHGRTRPPTRAGQVPRRGRSTARPRRTPRGGGGSSRAATTRRSRIAPARQRFEQLDRLAVLPGPQRVLHPRFVVAGVFQRSLDPRRLFGATRVSQERRPLPAEARHQRRVIDARGLLVGVQCGVE